MSACSRSTPGISITTVSASSVSKISVFGRNTRAGIVDSSFFSSSRFCCTSRSCAGAMTAISDVNPRRSADLDCPWLVALRAWQREDENTVAVLGRDPIRVQLHRQGDRPVEAARNALSTMHAGIAAVVDLLLSGNADGVSPHLQTEIILADARHLDDGREVVALPKDIDRRKRPSAAGRILKPIAV